MTGKSGLLTVLKALFVNKLRFGEQTSVRKRRATLVAIVAAVIAVLAVLAIVVYYVGGALAAAGQAAQFYILLLMSAAVFVLIFGIVSLVSTLFLSRDTDFFSTLPVKPSTVFVAKVLFVYLSEAAIAILFVLPAAIEFGIVARIALWQYYVVTVLSLVIVPALPLAAAAILAVPVMFIAGKLKNRSIVPLIFYTVLFVGFFALYFYFVFSISAFTVSGISAAQAKAIASFMRAVGYVMYPYTALSAAALGVPMYGLSLGASTAVNILIFLGSSAALIGILMLLGSFMYAQSARANNQTDNSKSKAGAFKTSSTVKALMTREYKAAFRSTQVTLQCFIGYVFIIMFAALFGFMNLYATELADGRQYVMTLSILMMISPVTSTAALTSFSREGPAYETLKTLPVPPKRIVAAKIAAWLVPAVPSAFIAAVTVNAFAFEAWRFFISLFGLTMYVAAFNVFAVLWDLLAPKLKWTDPMQAIKHNTRQLSGVLISMAVGIVPFVFSLLGTMLEWPTVAVYAVFWSVIFTSTVIFAVVDILLYRKTDYYFYRATV